MMVFMVIMLIVVGALLVMVGAMVPRARTISQFELKRRHKADQAGAALMYRRQQHRERLLTLRQVALSVLLIIFTLFAVARFGWGWGVVIAIIVALVYGLVGRLGPVGRQSQKLYDHYESQFLNVAEKFGGLLDGLRPTPLTIDTDMPLASRDELHHLMSQSHGVLSAPEKTMLAHGLTFADQTVSDSMTPREQIASISKKEMLGPLVLDDLHKTGHSHFPVIDKDLDHVVGILHVQDMLSLDVKRSVTAEKAMEPHVYYVHQNQTLEQALAGFLQTRHHLCVVVNDAGETVGLLSLTDVMTALLGRQLVDEFDAHDDRQAVARRRPQPKQSASKHNDS